MSTSRGRGWVKSASQSLVGADDIDHVVGMIEQDFDAEYYRSQLPPGSETARELAEHYVKSGWREGLDPSPTFSTRYYLEAHADVRNSGINPFLHYVGWGRFEGRLSKPEVGVIGSASQLSVGADDINYVVDRIEHDFDAEYYRSQLPPGSETARELVEHYVKSGWREGLNPSPTFSTRYYLESHADVRNSGINPFLHYIGWGRFEGRLSRPEVRVVEPTTSNNVRPAIARTVLPDQKNSQIEASRRLLEASDLGELEPDAQLRALDKIRAAFDRDYYLRNSPDLVGADLDIFEHYMRYGWREHRDPSPNFSTSYYLKSNPDIELAHINPFTHYILYGQKEGRRSQTYQQSLQVVPHNPFVTVIIPNYNHARFLKKRIDSVLSQTYQNFELLILDDRSVDNSVDIIKEYASRHPEKIKTFFNAKNSGSVFAQWKTGLNAAAGDLVWICESDDFCEPDFLENCIQPFRDSSVMISFGRVQFANEKGTYLEGLDQYREQAEPEIWSKPFARFAAEWFCGAFAIRNLIPNVGGCVFRRQPISDDDWSQTLNYRISGDWYLYLVLTNGGQIAYCPKAISYFRQHGKNTSVTNFRRPHYYEEHERIIRAVRQRWGTPDETCLRLFVSLAWQFKYVSAVKEIGPLTDHYSNDAVMRTGRSRRHILVCFLGFHLGGGELFPIYLANTLVKQGYVVSCLCLDNQNQEPLVRAMLDSRIAVYDAQFVKEYGLSDFVTKAGIDIIHTHNAGVEFLFFRTPGFTSEVPYVVTLHGSYEVTPMPDDMMFRVLRGVSHWVYLSEKNLQHLVDLPLSREYISSIPNGMPIDERPFELTRGDLGIGDSDMVFVIASRAIPEKGWEIAISALARAQQATDRWLHLLLCGSGPEFDRLEPLHRGSPRVHFLGFQERIPGIYRLGDVALLPTRFPGESHPLSLIQALQVGRPIIATDIGEIKNMLRKSDSCAGMLLPLLDDDESFVSATADAMIQMTDESLWSVYSAGALQIGSEYSINSVAQCYSDLFERLAKQQARRSPLMGSFSR